MSEPLCGLLDALILSAVVAFNTVLIRRSSEDRATHEEPSSGSGEA